MTATFGFGMTNPKDWFRRRRRELNVIPPEPADPFEGGPVLDVGRNSEILDGDEPQLARGSVPPPPTQVSAAARVIQPEVFAVRPERGRGMEEVREDVASGQSQAAATFALRRRAIPLPRRPAAAPDTTVTPFQAPPRAGSAVSGTESRSALTMAPPPRREREASDGEMPSFTLAAPGASWVRGRSSLREGGEMNAVLREAFTPTRPKQHGSLFSGRYRQMQRIIAAIEEERAHIVLYGERGSGKTSLANIIAVKAEEAGYHVVKFACSSELTFDDIFRGFLKRIPATFMADGLGAASRAGLTSFYDLLPQAEIGVADLVRAFDRLHEKHVILIIDEYDRVTNEATKNKLAELIKNMSDASAPVTILLIGVAENVDELLGKHPSLQRTLVTIPLPLMSRGEIETIIVAGEQRVGLPFDDDVRRLIVELAQGLPYYAQLLSLFAARSALRRRSRRVERQDLRFAVQRAAEEAESKVKDAYNLAIGTHGASAFKDVLYAAARAASDEFGSFTVQEVAQAAGRSPQEGQSSLALQYPLKKLTEPERGAMLRRVATPEGLRYQFANQMMRHYVLVRQAAERGLV